MTVLLIGILVCAVIMDLQTYRIPNFFILTGFVLGVGCTFLINGFRDALFAVVNSIIICSSLFLLYLVKALGAGDVKLFALIAVFEGVIASYKILLGSLFIGAVLGLCKVVVKFIRKKIIQTKKGGVIEQNQKLNKNETHTKLRLFKKLSEKKNRIHYSIPILMATLLFKGGIF